ncbi:Glutaredoxin [Operophtera brumata]|uniref:Glutaredoxin n=1 Tax=Operophtera brumata TaxID=104452 RepID=A0A0L7L6W9_OPEBR|nr:Glutaredoxin [Operophtera brumata]
MASSPEIQQLIKEAISQEKVVVFSKTYCPYCTLAKDAMKPQDHLLNSMLPNGIHANLMSSSTSQVFSKVKQPIKVIELDQRDDGGAIQDNLQSISGFRTVRTQIYVDIL